MVLLAPKTERACRLPADGPLKIFKRDASPQSQARRPNFARVHSGCTLPPSTLV
jgi:hypothetical protein